MLLGVEDFFVVILIGIDIEWCVEVVEDYCCFGGVFCEIGEVGVLVMVVLCVVGKFMFVEVL